MGVTPDAPCSIYHDLASKFGQLKYMCQWVQQVWKFIDPVIHASKAEQTAGDATTATSTAPLKLHLSMNSSVISVKVLENM